jgi:aminopeptidase N
MHMKKLAALLLSLAAVAAQAQSVFPVRDSSGEARNRSYDVQHYRIEVSIDDKKKSVEGTVTTTLVPFLPQLQKIEFDAEKMDIRRVWMGSKTLNFTVQPKMLEIQLDKPYSYKDTLTISVQYSCTPKKGLYFTQPDSGYPDKPLQIWTQGEDMDNHFWFPCYDFPNDQSTSEVIATVASNYTLVSNGKLVGVREDKKLGTKTWHWSETKPHTSYLIMIAAGNYALLKDKAGKLPLEYYVYPQHVEDAKVCFAETPAMIQFFSKKIGYDFAWEKYAQVLIADFIEGGMENCSATTLMDDATVYDARARVDDSPVSLIAHEMAHQWWGDVVTCRDWRHLWLNESFASYFDPLYFEYSRGWDQFEHIMSECQLAGINTDKHMGRKPVVSVGSYGTNIYPRGAAILHMLRFVLGDELFWKAIHHYIEKYQFSTVETNDLKLAIEEATGQNLYWFFEQWLYKAGHPVFDVSYEWSDSSKAVRLKVAQTQTMDSLTGTFRTPVLVQIQTPSGNVLDTLNILSKDTLFVLPAPAKPSLVLFDKGNWLLKELNFQKSRDEWNYQAEKAESPVDRLNAIKGLSAFPDTDIVVPLLARIALHDRFWAVRQLAVSTLRDNYTQSDSMKQTVKSTLIAASRDSSSKVRDAAVSGLNAYRGSEVVAAIRAALNDSSYTVVASALRSLAKADSANAEPTLLAYMNTPSHHNVIVNSALSALGHLDSTRTVDIALQKARYGEHPWTRYTALMMLSRYGKSRKDVVPFLMSLLKEKNSYVRSGATRILGEMGDSSVLPVLEKIAADKNDEDARAAGESAEKIKKRNA